MPEYLAPGVYIEEITGRTRSIEGVPTSTTAFVGATTDGPVDEPTRVASIVEFERVFGGLSHAAPLTYAVSQFFANEGRDAFVVRVEDPRHVAEPGHGIHVLGADHDFQILVIPPLTADVDVPPATWAEAARVCQDRRAIVLIDAPAAWEPGDIEAELATWELPRENAALYYPRVLVPDPLDGDRPAPFAPSGAVAGVMARTDLARGVWKAPAGTGATVMGAIGVTPPVTEAEGRLLNPRGVNTLREFPGHGVVVWGARTLAGDDRAGSEWKYDNVRRLFLFLEASIDRGIQWAVFEPNDEPLWAQLRQAIGSFLFGLWSDGAFPANKPEDAYFVRCDRTTMTQDDIDNGRVICLVGVAPVKPAEFVIFRFSQQAQRPDP